MKSTRLFFANLFLLVAVSFVTFDVFAYIPSSKFILSRLARNSGRGIYQIDQDVQIRTDGEPIVLHERWIVESGDTLRLSISGTKGSGETWRLETLYKDGKKTTIDASGNLKTTAQPSEFIEGFMHYRSSKGLIDSLIRHRVLPANFANHRRMVSSFNKVVYPYESLVRLGRTGGVIAYALGEPTPSNASRPNPGFWVEQDTFLFRRVRFPSKAEVEGENHLFASGGLRIPRDRNVNWETSSAQIRVISAKSIAPAAAQKLLSASSLTTGRANAAKLPDAPAVQEFYQRFR